MSARPIRTFSSTPVVVTLAALIAFVAARSARAAEGDPFAGDAPPTDQPTPPAGAPGPQDQGPPAAPVVPAAVAPAIVQELPASAYPEPTRGLYGGSLWLDMQGLQWPYTPRTGIGLSGYGWLDTMYKLTRLGGNQPSDHTTTLFQQGRFLFRVTPTYTNGSWFVQAQAEIVANKDQYVADANSNNLIDADDVWVRTGAWQKWDVTVGRFQAFDVYPLGMGLDLNTDERIGAYDGQNATPTPLYAADYLLYRPAGPGDVALHLYLSKFLRFELLGQWGNTGPENSIGGRPAVIVDLGILKLRGAVEYQYEFKVNPDPTQKDTIRNRGGAASAQIVLAPFVELGANFGYAVTDEADTNHGDAGKEDPQTSGNKVSFGGFANVAPIPSAADLLIGAGGNYTTFHNLYTPAGGTTYEHQRNLQTFVAVQYLFYKQLFVKLVAGYAKSHFENIATGTYDDDMYSVRLRLMYLF